MIGSEALVEIEVAQGFWKRNLKVSRDEAECYRRPFSIDNY